MTECVGCSFWMTSGAGSVGVGGGETGVTEEDGGLPSELALELDEHKERHNDL